MSVLRILFVIFWMLGTVCLSMLMASVFPPAIEITQEHLQGYSQRVVDTKFVDPVLRDMIKRLGAVSDLDARVALGEELKDSLSNDAFDAMYSTLKSAGKITFYQKIQWHRSLRQDTRFDAALLIEYALYNLTYAGYVKSTEKQEVSQ